MNPPATLRWGILGCGDVTETKGGPGAMNRDDGSSRVVACMRRDASKAADYARRHGLPRWYDDADALLADAEVNAVYVAATPDAHLPLAVACARAGKPCYVEKPMGRNGAEATRIEAAFADAGVPLVVAFYRRGLPRFVKAKEHAATLGRLTSVSWTFRRRFDASRDAGWRGEPARSGGGLLLDLASHAVDIVAFMACDADAVSGVCDLTSGRERAAYAFRAGGAAGSVSFDADAGRDADELRLDGPGGTVSLSCFGREAPVVVRRDGTRVELTCDHPPHVQRPHMEFVIAHLLGRGPNPAPASTAVRMHAFLESATNRL